MSVVSVVRPLHSPPTQVSGLYVVPPQRVMEKTSEDKALNMLNA